jgi:hypothetical protein
MLVLVALPFLAAKSYLSLCSVIVCCGITRTAAQIRPLIAYLCMRSTISYVAFLFAFCPVAKDFSYCTMISIREGKGNSSICLKTAIQVYVITLLLRTGNWDPLVVPNNGSLWFAVPDPPRWEWRNSRCGCLTSY